MTESLVTYFGFAGLLLLTYIPANLSVGGDLQKVMTFYLGGLLLRALLIIGAFLNDAVCGDLAIYIDDHIFKAIERNQIALKRPPN